MPALKRRRQKREPKRRFFIFCEGDKTESTYFAAVKTAHANALIEVNTIPGVGVPKTIAAAAAELARSLGLSPRSRKPQNSFEEDDEVWAVFDRDQHPDFDTAIDRCRGVDVHVGRSNPCFEVWLILHETDYDKPDDGKAAQSHLAPLRPEYDKRSAKSPDCNDLVTRVEIAEDRAEKQLERRVNQRAPYGRPSTTAGHLTRAIRDAAAKAT